MADTDQASPIAPSLEMDIPATLAGMLVPLMIFLANGSTLQTSWFVVSQLTELALILVSHTPRPA